GIHRLEDGAVACPSAKTWRGGDASAARSRAACPAQAAPSLSGAHLCLSVRTGQSAQRSHHPPYSSASRDRRTAPVSCPSAYAPPCVWFLPRQQRHRYPLHSAVSLAPPYSTHGALYGTGTPSVS